MQYFFCDLYDVPDISIIYHRVRVLVDMENGTFDESLLAHEPLLKDNMRFNFVWRSIFGIHATKMHAYEYANLRLPYEFSSLLNHFKTATFLKFGRIHLDAFKLETDFKAYVSNLESLPFLVSELRAKLADRFSGTASDKPLFDMYKDIWSTADAFLSYDSPMRISNPITRSILKSSVCKQYFPNVSEAEANRYVFCNDLHFMQSLVNNNGILLDESILDHSTMRKALRVAAGEKAIIVSSVSQAHQLPRLFSYFISWLSKSCPKKSVNNRNIYISEQAARYEAESHPIQIVKNRNVVDHNVLSLFCESTHKPLVTTYAYYELYFKKMFSTDPCSISLYVDKMIMMQSFDKIPLRVLRVPLKKADCVVIVDNRPNILSALACLVTMSNIGGAWDLVVCTHPENFEFYKTHVGECQFITHPNLAIKQFTQETYSDIMKDPAFWDQVSDYKRCLIIQDDGMILRKGLDESKLMAYDYVGAPWADVESNQHLKHYNQDLVGNGGLSLRNVQVMKKCCVECKELGRELWFSDSDVIAEDVFFAKAVTIVGGRVAPANEAQLFSSEQILCPLSFGIHKCWPYHQPQVVHEFLKTFY